jgi:hypothetical protein
VISHCDNDGLNAASALNLERFIDFSGTIENNTFSDNNMDRPAVLVGSDLTTPTVCLELTGNTNSYQYSLTNDSAGGTFNLSPCNVNDVNTGTIITSGTITSVQSCPGGVPCPP